MRLRVSDSERCGLPATGQLQPFLTVRQNDPLWHRARGLYSGLLFRSRRAGVCARQPDRGLSEVRIMR
jgi:hypothetical protein